MSKLLHQYYATDKEIHDLLISGKQKITEATLHELSKDRGIFYSNKTSRDGLVDSISLLIHDYHDVAGLIERRDHFKRSEKTTSITLDTDLSIDDIKEITRSYQSDVQNSEKVTSHQKGSNGLIINVEYNEYDYSKTRLIQRQRKDANIEFVSKDGITTIRMPATDKARKIVGDLREKIESKKKTIIKSQEIELVELTSSEDRTSFFTSLITKIPGYTLQTVTNIKVSSEISKSGDNTEELDDDDENESIKSEMLAVVHSVALNGQNLVASEQYQQLRKNGFFITSITWRSKQQDHPYNMVQFEASFENGSEGKGFKYSVRYASLTSSGDYTKNFKPVEDALKPRLFDLIEITARNVLSDLINKNKHELSDKDGDS